MKLTTVHATIGHRLLINYAADPDVVAALLPDGLRPQTVDGHAVVGICALRLTQMRPPGVPARLGVTSDDAAHGIAVEWDTDHGTDTGVFVLRRDSTQRLVVLAGGRLFHGVHGHASFRVHDDPEALQITIRTQDGLCIDATAHARTGSTR